MKNVLAFLGIMLLFGSLKKPDVVPCSKKVIERFYLKGKLVHVDKTEWGYMVFPDPKTMSCIMHGKPTSFAMDSVYLSLK